MVNLAAVRFLDEFRRTPLSKRASALCFYRLRLALPGPCKGRASSPTGDRPPPAANPLTSSLNAMRSREAAHRFLYARNETGSEPKRALEKRPRKRLESGSRPHHISLVLIVVWRQTSVLVRNSSPAENGQNPRRHDASFLFRVDVGTQNSATVLPVVTQVENVGECVT